MHETCRQFYQTCDSEETAILSDFAIWKAARQRRHLIATTIMISSNVKPAELVLMVRLRLFQDRSPLGLPFRVYDCWIGISCASRHGGVMFDPGVMGMARWAQSECERKYVDGRVAYDGGIV